MRRRDVGSRDAPEVTGDYFGALGIELVQGRLFQSEDGAGVEPVAVISASLARRLWPDGRAIGRRLRPGDPEDEEPWLRVVGVVREIRKTYSDSLYPDLYRPFAQAPRAYTALLVRTARDPRGHEREIRLAVAAENQLLALSDVEPMTELVGPARAAARVDLSASLREQ
jgi:hypothetical protein